MEEFLLLFFVLFDALEELLAFFDVLDALLLFFEEL